MKRYETIVGEEIYKFSDLIFRPLNNSIEESLIINKTFECANVAIEMAFSISAETKKIRRNPGRLVWNCIPLL